MTCACPNCGVPLDASGIVVNLGDNTITTPFGTLTLRPMEAEIAYVIQSKSPAYVFWKDLYEGVYHKSPDRPKTSSFFVHISHLRKAVESIGIILHIHYGRGYRMILVNDRQEKAA